MRMILVMKLFMEVTKYVTEKVKANKREKESIKRRINKRSCKADNGMHHHFTVHRYSQTSATENGDESTMKWQQID